jgi:hypothetical protein
MPFTRRDFLSTAARTAPAAWLASGGTGELRDIADELARFGGGPEEIARDERFWAPVQQAFTVDRAIINLNNAGVSPSPALVQEAMKRHLDFSNEAPVHTMWRVLEPLSGKAFTGRLRPNHAPPIRKPRERQSVSAKQRCGTTRSARQARCFGALCAGSGDQEDEQPNTLVLHADQQVTLALPLVQSQMATFAALDEHVLESEVWLEPLPHVHVHVTLPTSAPLESTMYCSSTSFPFRSG